jgi:hypothetical protein
VQDESTIPLPLQIKAFPAVILQTEQVLLLKHLHFPQAQTLSELQSGLHVSELSPKNK